MEKMMGTIETMARLTGEEALEVSDKLRAFVTDETETTTLSDEDLLKAADLLAYLARLQHTTGGGKIQ